MGCGGASAAMDGCSESSRLMPVLSVLRLASCVLRLARTKLKGEGYAKPDANIEARHEAAASDTRERIDQEAQSEGKTRDASL